MLHFAEVLQQFPTNIRGPLTTPTQKNYEDIKNPDVAAPVSQFLQHKPFHSVTFPYSWDEQQ